MQTVTGYKVRAAAGCGVLLAWIAFSGCGGKATVDKPGFAKVKTAAVVVYTVPATIEYRSDPRETKKSLLQAVAQAAAAGSGNRAATLANESFTETLNGQGLPFRVLTAPEVRGSAAFNAIDPNSFSYKPKEEGGMMGKALSFLGGSMGGRKAGAAPDGLAQFGLPEDWGGGNPLSGGDEEKRYLAAAAKALNVDAVIVVADPGYAFTCNACVGGTGDGSTGAAFMVAMVDRDGKPVLAAREWFATSGGHSAMAAYAVNPLQHETLFRTHGRRTAEVFAGVLKEEGIVPGKK